MSPEEARVFLLKPKSYFTLELPTYFQFDDFLSDIATLLKQKPLSDPIDSRESDHVNHTIVNNKDGHYTWRPMELIHPALYVSLVNAMTQRDHWKRICAKFRSFQVSSKIQCLSLPIESRTSQSDRAEQIYGWWGNVEQKAIELSLDYEFLIDTDLVDCYGSIYTHTIAWALHTKEIAKKHRRDKTLIGNIIDDHIQSMHYGQSNGIPQGSVLMDIIAEIVLGYTDIELNKKIKAQRIAEYQILRYRDDYRVFVNSLRDGEVILKCLSEVAMEVGLRLNSAKTGVSDEVIRSAIKADKLDWMFRKQRVRNLQKQLLIIYDHSNQHPNSGSLVGEMTSYYGRIHKTTRMRLNSVLPLISIVVDIAYHNPRTYPIAAAILSKLISFLHTTEEKLEVINKIRRKFSRLPNTGYLEIWLQRISREFGHDIEFEEPLCQLVRGDTSEIWDSAWVNSPDLLRALDPHRMVNREQLNTMDPIIPIDEVKLFDRAY